MKNVNFAVIVDGRPIRAFHTLAEAEAAYLVALAVGHKAETRQVSAAQATEINYAGRQERSQKTLKQIAIEGAAAQGSPGRKLHP